MEQEPPEGPFGFELGPFYYESSSARGEGHPKCGVCLFPLCPDAKPSHIDVERLSLIRNTAVLSTGRAFQMSADRGCTSCRAVSDFAAEHGAVDLELEQRSSWWEIAIYRDDGTSESFVFLAPPDKTPEDMDDQEHNSICRGHGAASIKGTVEDEVLGKARLWWERCIREHRCQTGPSSFRPRRLLRLEHSPDETETVVRLVQDLTEPVEYVALSHRWSEETLAVSLVNSNHSERMEKGLLSSDLPRLSE